MPKGSFHSNSLRARAVSGTKSRAKVWSRGSEEFRWRRDLGGSASHCAFRPVGLRIADRLVPSAHRRGQAAVGRRSVCVCGRGEKQRGWGEQAARRLLDGTRGEERLRLDPCSTSTQCVENRQGALGRTHSSVYAASIVGAAVSTEARLPGAPSHPYRGLSGSDAPAAPAAVAGGRITLLVPVET